MIDKNDTDLFEIITWPNPKLKKPARKVSVSRIPTLSDVIEKMKRTMEQNKGVGLAAPQVGFNERFFIAILDEDKGAEPIINPVIIQRSQDKCVDEEGCLSFPELYAQVLRSNWILVSWTDLTGKNIEARLVDFPARVFQHEFDHLNGILLVNNAIDGLYKYKEEPKSTVKKEKTLK